jgi:hypothetical protein
LQHSNLQTEILLGVLSFFIVFNVLRARAGGMLFIRRIPGIDHLDEAIGRATEMGRPLLFSSGLGALDIVTLQALTILSHIVRHACRLSTRVLAPVFGGDPTLFPVVEQVYREACVAEGKEDFFNPDDIRFLSGDQFAYASGVMGMIHREKVAGNFLFGSFAAESLLLAETGQQVGAIQMAGTPNTDQIPFFVAACDYTIIGEEYWAASAYISREPVLLGSLIGQDWGKIVIALLILIGLIAATAHGLDNWFCNLWKT